MSVQCRQQQRTVSFDTTEFRHPGTYVRGRRRSRSQNSANSNNNTKYNNKKQKNIQPKQQPKKQQQTKKWNNNNNNIGRGETRKSNNTINNNNNKANFTNYKNVASGKPQFVKNKSVNTHKKQQYFVREFSHVAHQQPEEIFKVRTLLLADGS